MIDGKGTIDLGAFTKGKDKITDSSTITGGHRNSKKLIKIGLVIIVVLGLIGGGIYYYIYHINSSSDDTVSEPVPEEHTLVENIEDVNATVPSLEAPQQ